MNRRKALKFTGSMAAAAVAGPSLLSLFQSCKNTVRAEWQPEFLTQNEASFLSTFVDMILPTTDTPGALDVKADMFMDKVMAHVYDEEGKQAMRANITQFNADCKANFGKEFTELNEADRIKVLEQEEAKGGQFGQGVWGTAVGPQEPVGFYMSLKSMTLWAYTSSEEIGKNVLNYDPVPGQYDGCIPVSDVGNRWTF